MNRMKKIISIVSAMLLVCGFSACVEKAADDSTVAVTTETAAATVTEDITTEAVETVTEVVSTVADKVKEKPIENNKEYEDFTYNEYENHIEVTGFSAYTAEEAVIPAEINGKPVTVIGDMAFKGCGKLAAVTVPESVTDIGFSAFEGTEMLRNLMKEDKPLIINGILCSWYAKEGDVIIPDGVKRIASGTFEGSKITNVAFPDSLESIGYHAFGGCGSLTSIIIPDGVTDIEYAAFAGCSELAEVTIPESVIYVEPEAFSSCKSLTEVNISDTLKEKYKRRFEGTPWYEAQKK